MDYYSAPSDELRHNGGMSTSISVTQIEAAINYWRQVSPATGEEARLCTQASALAGPYALMIFSGLKALDLDSMSAAAQQAYATAEQAWAESQA